MSALVDRITAVLRQHYLVDNWGCACSASVRGTTGWAAHVAEQVAEALQLTEERRVHVPWANEPKPVAVDAVITAEVLKDEHRWVSEWTAAEDQP